MPAAPASTRAYRYEEVPTCQVFSPRLLALVVTFPLFVIALASWYLADEPLDSDAIKAATHDGSPLWTVAQNVVSVCMMVVLGLLLLTGAVVAVQRGRTGGRASAAGHGLAGLLIVGGPTTFLTVALRQPHTPPAHAALYVLGLGAGLLAAIGVLTAAAMGAAQDRRLALVTVIPAAVLSLVLLVVFTAIAGFASQLRAMLPDAVVDRLDLSRLARVSGSFVDATLRWRHSDLLP